MPACTGPFAGMECCFDDGERFVAGLVATPLVEYYDLTQNRDFLSETLMPFLRGVARFYSSYLVRTSGSNSNGTMAGRGTLPFTCAQERCASGLDPPVAEINAHQDVAYARMALTQLLRCVTCFVLQYHPSEELSAILILPFVVFKLF
jgi:hypothetical protein